MMTAEDMLLELVEHCRSMDDWQLKFIEDIAQKHARGETFTATQLDKVREIYGRCMT